MSTIRYMVVALAVRFILFTPSMTSHHISFFILSLDLGLDESMAQFNVGARQQQEIIAQYEAEYKELEESVRHVEEIREALPPPTRQGCPQLIELEAS